ncbi:3-oxoacyl-ACP reductase [Auritidibacter sp. NML120779]|nr:3-oxoacyl-ACP reductase [Auritidibacter sp. NML120779]
MTTETTASSQQHAEAKPQDFAGKTAVVTGASRGIGLGIAEELIARGANVVITARKEGPLQEAAEHLNELAGKAGSSGRAIGIAGKSHDPEHRPEVLAQVKDNFGRLDVLVNNAGINPVYGPLAEIELEAVQKILEVNVISTLAWVQEVVSDDELGFKDHGSIVNLTSVSSIIPSAGIGLYGVSKSAVSHLTRTLAVELGPNIRVNAVAPAVVKTNFAKALYEGREETVAAEYPAKRLGTPEDIATAVAFLASDAASWITGEILVVDGGITVAGGSA